MKRFRSIPLSVAVLLGGLALLPGCKTTEANYRQAYEVAVAQRQESTGLDSTVYARIRNSAVTSSLIVGNDTLPLRTEYIGATKDGGIEKEQLRRYNIVVGQFKQIFNARQMRERLIGDGYGETFIVHTREPLYYVVIAASDTASDIIAPWQKIKADKSIVLRQPLPFVLSPAHLTR